MTNSERADQLLADAEAIAGEMRSALALHRWNLAVRRAQEVIELVAKGLINEMGVEIALREDQARAAVDGAEKALRFGRVLIDQLRGDG